MKRASLDIGSNSILLLIAEVDGGSVRPVLERFYAPRLGAGLDAEGRLAAESMRRAEENLAEALKLCEQHEVTDVRAAATAAVREAENREEFLHGVKERLGLAIRVLDGLEEAEITYRGVSSGASTGEGPAAVLDVGGGSTEVILGQDNCPMDVMSVPVGAVKLADRHGRSPGESREAVNWIESQLALPAAAASGRRLVGVGGTITTLAAVRMELKEYDAGALEGRKLTRGEIGKMIAWFRKLSLEQIEQLPGMEPGRTDIIEAGATIISVFMGMAGCSRITVSARGLRHGLMLDGG